MRKKDEVQPLEPEVLPQVPEVLPEILDLRNSIIVKSKNKGCFILEDEEMEFPEDEYPTEKESRPVSQETYDRVRRRASYREVEHKEAHELGAVLSNLDSKYFLDMNTEMVDEAISDFAIVQGMVKGRIYSPWIGELLETIKALSISSGRKGRLEKRDMTIGARKQRGLQGFSDALKQHPPSGQGDEQ
jgi:Zn-dependent metalloprotease